MLSFSNATGNIFPRLGKLALLVKQLKSYQTSQLANMTDTTNGVVAQYDAESDIQALMGSAYIGELTSPESIASLAQQIAEATLNRMVFRDNPRLAQTLDQQNTLASLQELIRQMGVAGATVRRPTVTATSGSFTGTGNGVLNASVLRPQDGKTQENAFAESLLVTCTADSYTGNQTAGNESFLLTGTGQQSDVFAFNWPLGSNAQVSLSAIDGDADETSGNLLNNSNFADWTSNVPDKWSLVVGTAGTDIVRNSTIVYGSGSSLQIVGDGATLVNLRQGFNSSSGTTQALDPLTQYSVCLFARRDGTAAGAGVLTVDLVDSNGSVLLDAAGTANSFTVDLTALNTTFASYVGTFRTPTIMPATYYFRLRLTTALTSGRSVYLGKSSLGEMVSCYSSGPYAAVHAGATKFVTSDYGSIVLSNGRGSGGTLSTWQTVAAQFFTNEMMSNELLLPSAVAGSESVSDSLIG